MGIFDLLIPDSSKKIYRKEFKSALYTIPELSSKEKEYVMQAFDSDLGDGLSKFELQRRCRDLMYKPGDVLESGEIQKIRDKLLKYFG